MNIGKHSRVLSDDLDNGRCVELLCDGQKPSPVLNSTVFEDNLAKHLKKCNSNEKPKPVRMNNIPQYVIFSYFFLNFTVPVLMTAMFDLYMLDLLCEGHQCWV